eukprot:CAMPEP_0182894294 /NCGR_PEP_ID=MMETSP0034_2-20130328/24993_1 /TAXON_ID=156128 /ORGANISM="Nephroselmis pyriformis, Strain CCMP717" /LENGTH=328 /DNA_ID=CAMNT_0025028073 /DNA_START=111 /DNA_END=1093 /DNA_ORIENTATION=-
MVTASEIAVAAVGLVLLFVVSKRLMSWFITVDRRSKRDKSGDFMEDPTSLDRVPCPSLWSAPTKDLSLVMPAYNEEERIASTMDETLRFLRTKQQRAGGEGAFTYEIIVVDDGSRDNTAGVVFEYVKRYGLDLVRVLRLEVNEGKGGAVKRGMMIARGRLILMLDADGATSIYDEERMEAEMPGGSRCDGTTPCIAVGSRAHLQDKAVAKRKWYRNILMHGFHALVTMVIGGAVRDTQCGFKMFSRAAARAVIPNQRLSRWCFDVEWLYLAAAAPYPGEGGGGELDGDPGVEAAGVVYCEHGIRAHEHQCRVQDPRDLDRQGVEGGAR